MSQGIARFPTLLSPFAAPWKGYQTTTSYSPATIVIRIRWIRSHVTAEAMFNFHSFDVSQPHIKVTHSIVWRHFQESTLETNFDIPCFKLEARK